MRASHGQLAGVEQFQTLSGVGGDLRLQPLPPQLRLGLQGHPYLLLQAGAGGELGAVGHIAGLAYLNQLAGGHQLHRLP